MSAEWMNPEWIGPAVFILFGILLVWFFATALRKARRRRREELTERDEELLPPGEGEEGPERRVEAEAQEKARPARKPAKPDRKVTPPVEEAPPEEEAELAEEEPALQPAPEAAEIAAPAADVALQKGLSRTSSSFLERLNQVFRRHPQVDRAVLDELEEVLLTADVGVSLTTRLVGELRTQLDARKLDSIAAVHAALKARMLEALQQGAGSDPLAANGARPRVILFVGVNGVGKTTTIGKVAAQLNARGSSVLLAAGDTFRAAAVEQLQIWGQRAGCSVIRGDAGADPASVIFNAVESALRSGAEFMLADTAGRLHTKSDLMDEIKKVKRAAGKAKEGAPDEVWLVVDATTGQNALQQAREFHQALGLTGVILTKLDGTAKGGVVIAIADALKIPVRFVGVGEKPDDLRPFDPRSFVEALFASSEAH